MDAPNPLSPSSDLEEVLKRATPFDKALESARQAEQQTFKQRGADSRGCVNTRPTSPTWSTWSTTSA
jgi:hypothetical protein